VELEKFAAHRFLGRIARKNGGLWRCVRETHTGPAAQDATAPVAQT
jgi:hypothetical protein